MRGRTNAQNPQKNRRARSARRHGTGVRKQESGKPSQLRACRGVSERVEVKTGERSTSKIQRPTFNRREIPFQGVLESSTRQDPHFYWRFSCQTRQPTRQNPSVGP